LFGADDGDIAECKVRHGGRRTEDGCLTEQRRATIEARQQTDTGVRPLQTSHEVVEYDEASPAAQSYQANSKYTVIPTGIPGGSKHHKHHKQTQSIPLYPHVYQVGQKSKLLVFSQYVNKTEKTGGT